MFPTKGTLNNARIKEIIADLTTASGKTNYRTLIFWLIGILSIILNKLLDIRASLFNFKVP